MVQTANLYETMPQLVPGGSPQDFSAVFAADFDLSLLPESPPEIRVKEEEGSGSWWEGGLAADDLEEARELLSPLDVDPSGPGPDHRLLRQVLKDTSFQKKYNLVPVSLGELGTGFAMTDEVASGLDLQREEIEPMLSLAMEQLKSEVQGTSAVLGISRDPQGWTEEETGTWLAWNSAQYGLPAERLQFFRMAGPALLALTEEEFQQRAPECGSLLYAQLELWRAASVEETTVDVSGLLQEQTPTPRSASSSGEPSDDEEEMEEGTETSSQNSPKSGGTVRSPGASSGSGAHIHLWQFLKELLASPSVYGSCIRWVDRQAGVFKIEDSVKVARLWGKRKNRPAMNYDKLSRSIRQYYKKGIMKKTERSQRLVYQFCHPYSL